MKKKTEKELENELIKAIKEIGGICYKFISFNSIGVPDRIIIFNGIVVFAEIKSEYKHSRLSKMQEYQINKIRQQGIKVYIISTSNDIKELIYEIKNM